MAEGRLIDHIPADPFSEWLGLTWSVTGDGAAETRVGLTPQHRNALGAVHGSVMHALADTGMGAALASALPVGSLCATISMTLHHLSDTRTDVLVADSVLVHLGSRVARLETTVRDGDGQLCARALGAFRLSRPRA